MNMFQKVEEIIADGVLNDEPLKETTRRVFEALASPDNDMISAAWKVNKHAWATIKDQYEAMMHVASGGSLDDVEPKAKP